MDKLSNFLGSYQFYLSESRKDNPDSSKIDAAFELCRASLAQITEEEVSEIYKEPVFSSVIEYIHALEKRKINTFKSKAQAV